jgi:hypothetical protein
VIGRVVAALAGKAEVNGVGRRTESSEEEHSMTASASKARRRRTSAAVVLLALAVGVQGAAGFGEPHPSSDKTNFDRSAAVVKSGRAVRVSGPISCPAGDTVRLRATISQHVTGAVAAGSWSATCTGRKQHWHTTASVTDGVDLKAGCAAGAGLAIIRHAGRPVDAYQWVRAITLTNGAPAGKIPC